MARLLNNLAVQAFRHRGRFLTGWLILIGLCLGAFAAFGSAIDSDFTIPGSSSQTARDTLAHTLPTAGGTSAQIVFESPVGTKITNAPYRAAVEAAVANAAHAPEVAAVVDPLQTNAISPDGRTALAQVQYTVSNSKLKPSSWDALDSLSRTASTHGLQVDVGGSASSAASTSSGPGREVGIVIAYAILAVTFGSFLAAGLPLLAAIAGLLVGVVGVYLASNVATVSSTAPSLALMIGLAVGIDYSVFILSRHRAELTRGRSPRDAAGIAAGTAGSAVVFAGTTVFIALAGLSVVGIPFLTVMGLSAAAAVLIAVLVALTLLPAILGFAGERLRPKPTSRTARREQPGAPPVTGERWMRLVTRRPMVTIGVVGLGLLIVAIPALQLKLALADNGSAAQDTTQRKAYDTVSAEFGPGFNGPLQLLVQPSDGVSAQAAAASVSTQIAKLSDVAKVTAPQYGTHRTAVLSVIPRSGPHDSSTKNLVTMVRNHYSSVPVTASGQATGAATVSVTGQTAIQLDVSTKLSSSLLPFAGLVVGLALILLLIVFRSIVVPIKAAAGFLLSIGATLGAVVAVFQWGWGANALGVSDTGPVVSFLPIILIAVLFGLAMDYEVFMVSRIREAYVADGDAHNAVIRGGRNAARIVTAAALIMFSVFAGFVSTPDATLKTIAFGLGFGVLVDAFLVRMTLVPAVLALLKDRSWWLPRVLERHLPNLDIEGSTLHQPAPAHRAPAHHPVST